MKERRQVNEKCKGEEEKKERKWKREEIEDKEREGIESGIKIEWVEWEADEEREK